MSTKRQKKNTDQDVPTFRTATLSIDRYEGAGAGELSPDEACEWLCDRYASLDAALALGLREDDPTLREAFETLRDDLSTLHQAAVTAWSSGKPVPVEFRPDDDPEGSLYLARAISCQHLGRDMQGGPHEFGFGLLADALVLRLDSAAKPRKDAKRKPLH